MLEVSACLSVWCGGEGGQSRTTIEASMMVEVRHDGQGCPLGRADDAGVCRGCHRGLNELRVVLIRYTGHQLNSVNFDLPLRNVDIMAISVEKLADEPIVLVAFVNPFDVKKDIPALST